jgi:F-type H+-transporting ATPase subunit b
MKTCARLVAATLPLLTAAQALAAGGGGEHGGGAHHAPHFEWFKWDMNAPPVGWLIFDFALFLFLLVKFAGKPLSNALAQRHHAVKKAIEEAAAAKADAVKKAAEFDARLKTLDAEIAALREEFKKSGEAARERLQDAGKRTADRLLKDTQLQIGAEEARATQALRQEAARLALEMAEKLVGERVKDADHKKFKDDFVAGLRS